MLDDLKFVSNKDPRDVLGVIERKHRNKKYLQQCAQQWRADNPTSKNFAKQIAEHIAGKSIVVYGADIEALESWRTAIAELAHNVVFARHLEHGMEAETAMWRSHPPQKIFAIIVLETDGDSKEATDAFAEMSRKLSGLWPQPLVLHADPTSNAESRAWLSYLAEMSATYLAILNGISPTLKSEEKR